jgi:peptidoglycan/LPS O-acetylase OafA/YrhL
MAIPEKQSHSLPVLDGLRAISILLVLACHLLPLGPKALEMNESVGAMGMSLFFALSGFLITSNLLKNQDIFEFLIRRFARILPLAYLYTIVVFVIFTFDPKTLLWTDLFSINYLTAYINGWNAHFWSLCVEMQFYLAIAIAVQAFGKRAIWLVWPACITVTLLRINADAYLAIKTHLRADEILTGACVATFYRPDRKIKITLTAVILAALVWATTSWTLTGPLQYLRPYAAAALLFLSVQYALSNPRTLLASKPARYIAGISYALYVIHPATAYGWMSEGDSITKYLIKRPISFALTFSLAHLSTFHWESHWQIAAKQWIAQRRARKITTAIQRA